MEEVAVLASPIPAGTAIKARIKVLDGNYEGKKEALRGLAFQSESGTVYVKLMFQPIGSDYEGCAIYFNIGLHSAKDPSPTSMFVTIGQEQVGHIMNSAHGLRKDDASENAQALRKIEGYRDLDGLMVALVVRDAKPYNGRISPEVHYFLTASDNRYHTLFNPAAPDATQKPVTEKKADPFEDFDEDIPF